VVMRRAQARVKVKRGRVMSHGVLEFPLCLENPGKLVVRRGRLGVELQRSRIMFGRLLEVSLFEKGCAKQYMSLLADGLGGEGLLILGNRFIEFPLLVVSIAKKEM